MKKKSSVAPANKAKINAGHVARDTAFALGAGLAGGLAGAAIGRPSLGVGIATTIGGAVMRSFKQTKAFSWPLMVAGMAMAVSPGPKEEPTTAEVSGLSGLEGSMADAKERAISFMKGLGKKTYIDKVAPEFAVKMGLQGLGNARVFLPEMSTEMAEAQVNKIIYDMQNSKNISASSSVGSVDSAFYTETMAGPVDAGLLQGIL